MTITAIILAAVVVGGTGLFIGVFLGIAGKKFAVEVDEREEALHCPHRTLFLHRQPSSFRKREFHLARHGPHASHHDTVS